MPDVVSPQKRSRMMAGIRGKNTKPELMIRSALHRMGYRYRLHDNRLPGKPDMVFPMYQAVIHIQGCFWHGHDCHLFKWPATRAEFWKAKIDGNLARDRKNAETLGNMGWRQMTIWECAMKGRTRRTADDIIAELDEWLASEDVFSEIRGYAED